MAISTSRDRDGQLCIDVTFDPDFWLGVLYATLHIAGGVASIFITYLLFCLMSL